MRSFACLRLLGRRSFAVLLLIVAMVLAACGTSSTPTPTTGSASSSNPTPTTSTASTVSTTPVSSPATASQATPSTTASPTSSPATGGNTTQITLYFIRQGKIATVHRVLPKTQQVGTAALAALLQGPSAADKSNGLTTAIPDGVKLLNLTISNAVATADLSNQFAASGDNLSASARLAQVVYTLTQFSSIQSVLFKLDGKPVSTFGGSAIALDHPTTRSDFESVTPAIFVESPAAGDAINSPVRLTGTANTFEAAFVVSIVDASGKQLVEKQVMATSGSGTRGTFDTTVTFDLGQPGAGKIVAFERSAKDGSKINVVEIPVALQK